jgi:hypothetical protein
MSGVHALAPAPAETRTCRVCGLADPPPDPTCHDGRNHRVGTTTGCLHYGRLLQACARRSYSGSTHEAARAKAQLTQLVRRRLPRHVAGGADQ